MVETVLIIAPALLLLVQAFADATTRNYADILGIGLDP
jgi:hypothetical protein